MARFLRQYYPYFPIIGLGLYLFVFSIAANQYPGGSINRPEEIGYSFFNNFLCDVMNPYVHGDKINEARTIAITSHLILSLTMICFFYILPELFPRKNNNTRMIRFFGMLTMTVFALMITEFHDLIVSVTAILGTIALIPFFIELCHYPDRRLIFLAYLCFGLSIIVYFIFVTKIGFYYLPFLQKITFIIDAIWVIWVSLIVYQKNQVVDALQASFD